MSTPTTTILEQKTRVTKKLTNGSYFIKDGDIKMECSKCGKRFWVHLYVVISDIVRHGASECGSCAELTLIPLE